MCPMVATDAAVPHKTKVTPEELLAMPDGGHYELIDGELSGEDVLPGFRCKVAELFPKQAHTEAHGPTKSDTVSQTPGS
jgi:hypothetical protein